MQNKIMVLTESNKNIEVNALEEKEGAKMEPPSVQKLYSCEEFEKSIGTQLQGYVQLPDTLISNSKEELKQVDPAIMSCSSKTKLTRYNQLELNNLKFSKLSREIPQCLIKPEILTLKILDQATENTILLTYFKAFGERTDQLNTPSWNPSLVQFVADYNRIMGTNPVTLNSHTNVYNNPFNALYQPPRQFPIVDQQQATLLDKIHPYDRNNFFDTITSNTMGRPPAPAPPRMGISSFNNAPTHEGYPNRNFNNNGSYGYNRKPVNGKGSYNFYTDNNNAGKSYKDKPKELPDNVMKKSNDGVKEDEPEWYTNPATVDDIVDLHGFEDDTENQPQPKVSGGANNEKGYGTPSLAYRRSGYNQNRNVRINFNNNGVPQNQNVNPGFNNNVNNNNAGGGNNSQRFRNPLHFNKQPMSPNWQNPINPFFELWQRNRFAQGEPRSFNALGRGNVPPNLQQMHDIESTLKATNYLQSFIQKNQAAQQQQLNYNTMPITQFFNQWPQQQQPNMNGSGVQMNVNGGQMPTAEQLQQHTTQIMNNAILRKNQNQFQYQNQYK